MYWPLLLVSLLELFERPVLSGLCYAFGFVVNCLLLWLMALLAPAWIWVLWAISLLRYVKNRFDSHPHRNIEEHFGSPEREEALRAHFRGMLAKPSRIVLSLVLWPLSRALWVLLLPVRVAILLSFLISVICFAIYHVVVWAIFAPLWALAAAAWVLASTPSAIAHAWRRLAHALRRGVCRRIAAYIGTKASSLALGLRRGPKRPASAREPVGLEVLDKLYPERASRRGPSIYEVPADYHPVRAQLATFLDRLNLNRDGASKEEVARRIQRRRAEKGEVKASEWVRLHVARRLCFVVCLPLAWYPKYLCATKYNESPMVDAHARFTPLA